MLAGLVDALLSTGTKVSDTQRSEIKNRIEKVEKKPLIVTVLGQTGVGKSSLINALFGVNLKTNNVQPETKFPEKHVEKNKDGNELWFWDLPGIGESPTADAGYLKEYADKILEADVVLWLCHADSRSITFDFESIQKLLIGLKEIEQERLLSKMTFVLSKADMITIKPWNLIKQSDESAILIPSNETEELLNEKAKYFKDSLVMPFTDKIKSCTWHSGNFNIKNDQLEFDQQFAYYSGVMTDKALKELENNNQHHKAVLTRLYKSSEVIYCSSRFRYNLYELMAVIANKLDHEASIRFRSFISQDSLNTISWENARKLSNLVFSDKSKIIFNLEEH